MTPLRVLHRRSPLVRPKTIHYIRVEQLEDNYFIVDLKTESGTYIKEFIHSDFGRTRPSLGSLLGCRADILSLDVLVRPQSSRHVALSPFPPPSSITRLTRVCPSFHQWRILRLGG